MRTYRVNTGPFVEALHFELSEIRDICLDALRAMELLPSKPSPVRIERFIEKQFKLVPRFEDLGAGILGSATFGIKGVEQICISRSMAEEDTHVAQRRVRSTCAHEAGHGLLHAHLFAIALRQDVLVEAVGEKRRFLCRGEHVGENKPKTPWWEFQANRAIPELLLPRNLVDQAISPFLSKRGLMGVAILEPSKRGEAIQTLADIFDVNPVVVKLRLEEFHPENQNAQMCL